MTSRQLAALIAIPAATAVTASFWMLPWLIGTRRRLDNDYWETQLLFAIIALVALMANAPAMVVRACGFIGPLAIWSWVYCLLTHAWFLFYASQSHLQALPKTAIVLTATMLLLASYRGLVGDLAGRSADGVP